MNVRDALYHAVHDYEGGAERLAPRMGLAASTLRSMANPNSADTHGWPLHRFQQVMDLTGDHRPLDALADQNGGVFVPLARLPCGEEELGRMVAEMGKDFGAVCAELESAMRDKRLTPREVATIRQKAYALNEAVLRMCAVMQQRMEADPLNGLGLKKICQAARDSVTGRRKPVAA